MLDKKCVYKITNQLNGKAYIGLTSVSLRTRLRQHRHYKGSTCKLLARAIAKYGWNSFNVEVLFESNDLAQLKQFEIQAIEQHSTLVPKGYNLSKGGEASAGRVVSREKRIEASRARGGLPVVAINIESKETKEFYCVRELEKELKLKNRQIYGCLNNKAKSCFGWVILYKHEYDNLNGSEETKASLHVQRLGLDPSKEEYNSPTSPRIPKVFIEKNIDLEQFVKDYKELNSTYKVSTKYGIGRDSAKEFLRSINCLNNQSESARKRQALRYKT